MACWCDHPAPTRRHWLWTCKDCERPVAKLPFNRDTCEAEDALAVPICPLVAPPRLISDLETREDIAKAIDVQRTCIDNVGENLGSCHGNVTIAMDGGADKKGSKQWAGWGVAVPNSIGGTAATFSDWVHGMDQSSWIAEVMALLMVCKAAASIGASFHALIDNLGVHRAFKNLMAGKFFAPRYAFGLWIKIWRLTRCALHSSSWVPSYGKKIGKWKPDVSGQSEDVWRSLNRAADTAATFSRDQQLQNRFQEIIDAESRCLEWSSETLLLLRQASKRYFDAIHAQLHPATGVG